MRSRLPSKESEPPRSNCATVCMSSEWTRMIGSAVGRSVAYAKRSMVALSTAPPCSSAYGERSVPPPAKLMRRGARARTSMGYLLIDSRSRGTIEERVLDQIAQNVLHREHALLHVLRLS